MVGKLFKFYKKHINVLFVFSLVGLASFHLLFAIKTELYFKVDDFTTLAYFLNNSWWEMVSTFFTKGDLFGFRRVVGYIGFRGLFDIFRVNQYGYLITNHILHTANVILVFLLAKKVSKNLYSSFFAGVLFNGLYLFYFSNFHEYLLTFLSLLSIYVFVKFPKKNILSALLFLLALMTKEMAFTVILFLGFWSYINSKPFENLKPHFFVLLAYTAYQVFFFVAGKTYPSNQSYTPSFSPLDIFNNLSFYINPLAMVILASLSLIKRNYKKLLYLLVFLIGLSPVLPLNNRHEMYYFLLPSAYLYIYLAAVLPRFSVKSVFVYLVVFLVLGGRSLLPTIPKQTYPNWQKISMKNVSSRIEQEVSNESNVESIDLSDINLERDAKLMLTEGALELFLKKEVAQNYDFEYKRDGNILIVLKEK